MAESKPISHIIVSPEYIRVRPGDSSESISCLLSGTVDVAVAEGVVLVLVLGVELAGGDGGDSSTGSSNYGSSCNSADSGDTWGSSNSADSGHSWGSSNSWGSYSRGSSADSSNCMDSRSSSNCTVSSNSWGSVSTGIGIGIAKSSSTIGTVGTVVESISSGISVGGGHKGRDKNQNLHVVILLLLLNGVPMYSALIPC